MQSCKNKTIRHPLQCSMLPMKIQIKANRFSLPAFSLCSCAGCVYANAIADQTHSERGDPGWLDGEVWSGQGQRCQQGTPQEGEKTNIAVLNIVTMRCWVYFFFFFFSLTTEFLLGRQRPVK